MSEIDIVKRIQIALSTVGARVFRNNTGLGWVGNVQRFSEPMKVMVYPGDIVIRAARPLHAGLIDGGSDLIGFDSQNGKFVACEVKLPGEKPTKEQTKFINNVINATGIAFVAHSPEEAILNYKKQNEDANHGED